MNLSTAIAHEIVEDLRKIFCYDLNIMNTNGIIIA